MITVVSFLLQPFYSAAPPTASPAANTAHPIVRSTGFAAPPVEASIEVELLLLAAAAAVRVEPSPIIAFDAFSGSPFAYNAVPEAATEYVVSWITVGVPGTTGFPSTKYVRIAVGAGAVSINKPPELAGAAVWVGVGWPGPWGPGCECHDCSGPG